MTTLIKETLFKVPAKNEVSDANKLIFDNIENAFGRVPNLYATLALHANALGDYLTLQNRNSTLNHKEKEVINLVVSQVNGCKYCLAAHTTVAKMYGFSEEEIISIRKAEINFDDKLQALASFTQKTTINRGKGGAEVLEALISQGYKADNIIDIIIAIGDKTISNYLHSTTDIPVDWDEAPVL